PPKVRTSPSACTTGLRSPVEGTALEWADAAGGIRGRYPAAARRERAKTRLRATRSTSYGRFQERRTASEIQRISPCALRPPNGPPSCLRTDSRLPPNDGC